MATGDSIKIASANCPGLGSVDKRNDVFNYLKNKKYNIICLQDILQKLKNQIFLLPGDIIVFSVH